ncbi:digestive cysteine proteinase 1 [Daktulosphaira vitifoliae]|uniref:digestive cysteine proteinase 1 n=1 Tax=Daktulosphaira vitifoliae TaxID=58002 RepID=UPI0021AA49AF|nr:digestive cysteine proteinase 1 [Daktulosphaira vitifoliae]
MGISNKCIVIFLVKFVFAAISDVPPSWSSYYTLEADIFIPYAEVHEPFKAWYDSESSNSRIDYYNGMAKTYQLQRKGDNGSSLKIVPVTTETEINSVKCLQVNGSKEMHITPQQSVPDLKDFKLAGEELIDGFKSEKWMSIVRVGDKVSKYIMWLYRMDSEVYPLRYEMKGFNSLFGSHFDHYIVVYRSYDPSKPDPSIFNVEEIQCESFPGPGIDHVYTFNPMKEFMNNYDDHVDIAFDNFKHHHKRNYDNSTKEHFDRKNYFRQNLRFIHSKNRANTGYTLAVNHLADKSELELKSLYGYKKTILENNGGKHFSYDMNNIKNLPDSIDWRILGAVNPVKDQSVCGSCWSFGTTGAVEGAYFLKHGHRASFSEQALVDCSWGFGNNGCDGGEDFRAYQWIEKHGIPTEDAYGPYLSQDGFCHVNNSLSDGLTKISGFVNVTPNDEEALKSALVNHGPISIAIYASLKSFSFYSNGVYYDPKCLNDPKQMNHAVLLVGYGDLNGSPYWLVKNSWSNFWGNDGYILMSRKDNNCGVLSSPTYVTM